MHVMCTAVATKMATTNKNKKKIKNGEKTLTAH